jgi:DNA-binding transcriptional LysR family regulator
MDYRQLEVFRAVMDAGSVSAAARLLGVSQPEVSRKVARLEADFDIDLFARERGRLMPTAHALALYREVSHAFEGVERVLNLVRKMRAHNTGTLRIAAPYSACEVLLPRIIARLAKRHPDLRYAVELGRYEAIAAMVAKREVDIGILKEPVAHSGISTLPLVRHAGWLQEIRALLSRSGDTPLVRLETHAVGAACGFAASGLGIALVPELLGAQFADRGVVLRPLAERIEQRFAVAFPKGLQREGLVGEFRQAAVQVARELLREGRRGA